VTVLALIIAASLAAAQRPTGWDAFARAFDAYAARDSMRVRL
jgi:hypothetical protein